MQTLNANEAKTNFGEMLFKVQKSPIQINKNGKPVAVVQSIDDFNETEEMKLALLKVRYEKAQEDIRNNETVDGKNLIKKILNGEYDK